MSELAVMTEVLILSSPELRPYITTKSSGKSAMKVPITVHWIVTLEEVTKLLISNTGRRGAKLSVESQDNSSSGIKISNTYC